MEGEALGARPGDSATVWACPRASALAHGCRLGPVESLSMGGVVRAWSHWAVGGDVFKAGCVTSERSGRFASQSLPLPQTASEAAILLGSKWGARAGGSANGGRVVSVGMKATEGAWERPHWGGRASSGRRDAEEKSQRATAAARQSNNRSGRARKGEGG